MDFINSNLYTFPKIKKKHNNSKYRIFFNRYSLCYIIASVLFISLLIIILINYNSSIQLYTSKNKTLVDSISQVESSSTQLENNMSKIKREIQELNKDNEEKEKKLNQIKQVIKEKSKLLTDSFTTVGELRLKVFSLLTQEEKLTEMNGNINRRIDQYRIDNKNLQKQIEKLKQQLKSLQSDDNGISLYNISAIISSAKESSIISKWIKEHYSESFTKLSYRLIFRFTDEALSWINFGRKCDDNSYHHLLILFKTKNGDVFGGFTNNNFSSMGYKTDKKAFIFNLSTMKKYEVSDPHHSIYCDENFPIVFGTGDIVISYIGTTYCNFPMSYGEKGKDEKYEVTGGTKIFYIEEVEVFNVFNN